MEPLYNHLTLEERENILKYYSQGKNKSEIARLLDKNRSSITREFQRNSVINYSPSKAQLNYNVNKSKCGRKKILVQNNELKKAIRIHLNQEHSPEQIEGVFKLEGKSIVCYKTIYNAINNGDLPIDKKTILRRRGKPYKKATEKRGKIPDRVMIDKRPIEVNKRITTGHFESDTIVGKNHKSAIATYVDRYSRLTLIGKMNDRTAQSLVDATLLAFKFIPIDEIKSFTSDNGHEFSNFKQLEKLFDIKQYFAFPHHPWEKIGRAHV